MGLEIYKRTVPDCTYLPNSGDPKIMGKGQPLWDIETRMSAVQGPHESSAR